MADIEDSENSYPPEELDELRQIVDEAESSEPPSEWPDLPVTDTTEGEEGDDDGHSVPADLLELHEILEFQAAVEAEGNQA